eukprot:TRINITY_DN1356_c0_g1_i1.p1 TRINITY_DN1356_c0_g1~~TRINITY_DN1356_c0_g1_i1.p1  ORF type:complete len:334 (+),score=60.05 TRINITY_DN1356_c0_g1_i1:627-1628(+)
MGASALHYAVDRGDVKIIRKMLAGGADPLISGGNPPSTAIDLARLKAKRNPRHAQRQELLTTLEKHLHKPKRRSTDSNTSPTNLSSAEGRSCSTPEKKKGKGKIQLDETQASVHYGRLPTDFVMPGEEQPQSKSPFAHTWQPALIDSSKAKATGYAPMASIFGDTTQNEQDETRIIYFVSPENSPKELSAPKYTYTRIDAKEVELKKKVQKGEVSVLWKGEWRGAEVFVRKLRKTPDDFEEEIEKLAKVTVHPNLVRFCGASFPECMILTEFVAGHINLGQLLRSQQLTWEIKNQIAIQIVSAMKHLHSQDIVHHDLTAVSYTHLTLPTNREV